MPRGQRNNNTPATTRTTRPRLTDEQKAVAEVEKLLPRVKTTTEKLKKVRAQAAELDEQLKADQKLLTWALQNPFLPEGYAEQADVPEGDAGDLSQVVAGEQYDAEGERVEEESTPASEDDLPGADQLGDADENLGGAESNPEADDDDPFAGR